MGLFNKRWLLSHGLALGCALTASVAQIWAQPPPGPQLIVLGVAQDGGYPHAGCKRDCCQTVWSEPTKHRLATCLGLVDRQTGDRWFFECTPNFPAQLDRLDRFHRADSQPGITGILLTHAHIGHYAGLVHLGREVMGARNVPVFAMPRMREFLTSNGPWSQLLALRNIELRKLTAGLSVSLNQRLSVTPLLVPHRDEFSETVAFVITGPQQSVLFLPDIDKWERWEQPIEKMIKQVDLALLDGTFFANGELPGREMSEIPHPFIRESLDRLGRLPREERAKVRFIHLNHTNPALQQGSPAEQEILASGFAVAREGDVVDL